MRLNEHFHNLNGSFALLFATGFFFLEYILKKINNIMKSNYREKSIKKKCEGVIQISKALIFVHAAKAAETESLHAQICAKRQYCRVFER